MHRNVDVLLLGVLSLAAFVAVLCRLPLWVLGLLLLAGCLVLPWMVRRRTQAPLLGPLFIWELVHLARRGRGILLRFLYVFLLFSALWSTYQAYFPFYDLLGNPFDTGRPLPGNEMARFAVNFALAVLVVQAVVVLTLTPAYLAPAIAGEKERGTLALLFTTHLHNHEIVLGKLLARLMHLAWILLAGLPILSLLQLWGGVDLFVLLAVFAITGATLFSVGSFCILCSVMARTVLEAVLASYWFVVAVTFFGCLLPLSSPLAFLSRLNELLGGDGMRYSYGRLSTVVLGAGGGAVTDFYGTLGRMVGEYVILHGGVAIACLSLAVALVRRRSLQHVTEPKGVPLSATQRAIPRSEGEPVAMPAARPVSAEPPSTRALVSDSPLLWKEAYLGNVAADAPEVYTAFSILMGLMIAGGFILFLANGNVAPYFNFLIRIISFLLLMLWCLGTAVRAGSSFVRERQQQTLDTLLVLPVPRERLVGAKWLGSILRFRHVGVCLLITWLVDVVTAGIHPVMLPLLVLSAAVHLALLASLGVWISLVARNLLWAQLSMGLMLLFLFLGSNLVQFYTNALAGVGPGWLEWQRAFFDVGLNPARSWWFFGMSWREFNEIWASHRPWYSGPLGASLAGTVVLALLAELFWQAACLRLRREGR
jgi:ABC-type transport system involved in multi-copper enzyme maturation permease subunit